MKLLVEKVQYKKYNWKFCAELKVILLSCFACSCPTKRYFPFGVSRIEGSENTLDTKKWHKLESLNPGQKNVVNNLLVNPEKVKYISYTSNLDS